MKTKIVKTIPTIPKIFNNLMIQMMMWPLMEIIFSMNNQNNHVCRNYSDDFLGMCDPPDVEPDDISEANYQNSFAIDVVEDKEKIKFSQLPMLAMKILKLDLKLHMVDEIMN